MAWQRGIDRQIETPVPGVGAGVNKVSVRNANNPMPTGQREIGAILLSRFEDGHYSSQKPNKES